MSGVLLYRSEGCCPVGASMAGSVAAVRAGISRVTEHPFMVGPDGEPVRGAVHPDLDPALVGVNRIVALGVRALTPILAAVPPSDTPIPLLLSLPESRPGWTEADDRVVTTKLAALALKGGHTVVPRVVARGHAGGLAAIRAARVSLGQAAELCIVGGLDTYWQADTIDHLIETRQLISEETRGAFHPGEGAGFLLLGTRTAGSFLRAQPVAIVSGIGVAQETNTFESNRENLGHGMTDAVRDALSEAGGKPPIARVLCDLNGQRHRSEELGFVALRQSQSGVNFSEFQAPADSWGDLGAASGPFLVALAAEGWRRGYRPQQPVLVMTGSIQELRSAAVLAPRGAP